MDDFLILPVIKQIRHKPVIQIDILFLFPLWYKVIIKEHTGDRNLCKGLDPLIQATKTVVTNLIWVKFTAIVARSTIVTNLI
ncbi:MAG: hypothetical protein C0413_01605 [Clostridiales bacterium]|nr:hypothetical protein [Clostridiales bacterium]